MRRRLIAYAAQIAWLLVKPRGSEESRAEIFGESYVELNALETLHLNWLDLGRMGQMGGFAWSEMIAYDKAMNLGLSPLQFSVLREMSEAYSNYCADNNPFSLSPLELLEEQEESDDYIGQEEEHG